MTDKYPKSDGGLWPNREKNRNDPKTNNWPDWKGHLKVSLDQLNVLVAMARAGQEPTLQVAMWDREAKNQPGNLYKHLSSEAFIREQPQQQYQPQPPQQYQQPQQPPQGQPTQQYQQPSQGQQQPQQQYQQPPAPVQTPQQQQYPQQGSSTWADEDIPF